MSASTPATRGWTANTVLASALLVFGLAQAVLVALALARILAPDYRTFGPVGFLSGLGMAALGLVGVLLLRWRRPAFRRVAWLGVLGGLLTAATWATLLGGTFYTNDVARVAIIVTSDCLFAIALVAAARLTVDRGALPGLSTVATIMSVRAVVELALIALVVSQSDAAPGQNVPVVVLAVSVLIGWIVLCVWEIRVGAGLLRKHDVGDPALTVPR